MWLHYEIRTSLNKNQVIDTLSCVTKKEHDPNDNKYLFRGDFNDNIFSLRPVQDVFRGSSDFVLAKGNIEELSNGSILPLSAECTRLQTCDECAF